MADRLDCHPARQHLILGFVHLTHAADGQDVDNPIRPETFGVLGVTYNTPTGNKTVKLIRQFGMLAAMCLEDPLPILLRSALPQFQELGQDRNRGIRIRIIKNRLTLDHGSAPRNRNPDISA